MEIQAIIMYSTGGIGCCTASVVLLSNLMSVYRYVTRDGEEPATTNSLIGWALSLAFLILGPCGLITSMIACLMGQAEKKKVAMGDASGWTMIPTTAITMNVVMSFIIMGVMCAGIGISQAL